MDLQVDIAYILLDYSVYATYQWSNISPSVFQGVIPTQPHAPYNVMPTFYNPNLA